MRPPLICMILGFGLALISPAMPQTVARHTPAGETKADFADPALYQRLHPRFGALVTSGRKAAWNRNLPDVNSAVQGAREACDPSTCPQTVTYANGMCVGVFRYKMVVNGGEIGRIDYLLRERGGNEEGMREAAMQACVAKGHACEVLDAFCQ